MLFFDDLPENIDQAKTKGITSILLGKSGVTMELFKMGLKLYNDTHKPVEPLVFDITPSLPDPLKVITPSSSSSELHFNEPTLLESPLSFCVNISQYNDFDFEDCQSPNKRSRYDIN